MAEWLKAPDSKSEVVARLPGVRIPPLPPMFYWYFESRWRQPLGNVKLHCQAAGNTRSVWVHSGRAHQRPAADGFSFEPPFGWLRLPHHKETKALKVSVSRRRIDHGLETAEFRFCPDQFALGRLKNLRHGNKFAALGEAKRKLAAMRHAIAVRGGTGHAACGVQSVRDVSTGAGQGAS